MRFSCAFVPLVLAAAVVSSMSASVRPAAAALYSQQQALPAATVQQFLANPAAWLAQFPNGGAQMIAQVRDLVASDPATLNALIALLASANPDQATAIGTGLGQVAVLAVKTDQALAILIQTDVVGSQNVSAVVAFSAVVGGDIQLAAAGPGGGGGGGGGESQTGQGGTIGGLSTPNLLNLSPFSANTADTFPANNGTPGTPGSQVSATTP